MESKARILGHSVHKMLVMFPVGLLMTSVVFDTAAQLAAGQQMTLVAYWLLAAGLVGGLVAVPFGLVDWLAIPTNTRAKRIGGLHAMFNVVVLGLFGASWWLRPSDAVPAPDLALLLSLAGALVLFMSAWLGGELVSRLGIGASADAHADAPSSLSHPSTARSEQQSDAVRGVAVGK